MGDSFWFLAGGAAEEGEKRLIRQPKLMRGRLRRIERSSPGVHRGISARASGAGLRREYT